MSDKDKHRNRILQWISKRKLSKTKKKSSEDSSFSEKNMTENIENSSQEKNPFTQSGEHSTLALLKNLYGQDGEEKRTERPCGSELPKESKEIEIPIPEGDLNSWEFPNAQAVPSTLTPRSGRMENLNVVSGYSSAMMFDSEFRKPR